MIQRTVRQLFKEKHSTDGARRFMEDQTISADLKKSIDELGLLGVIDVTAPPNESKGMIQAMIIAQEAGRHLVTYPILETMAGLASLKACGRHEQLAAEVEAGKKLLTIAWVTVTAKAYSTEAGYVLSGVLKEVPFAGDADVILANVRISGRGITPEEEETIIAVNAHHPAVMRRRLNSVDETYPLYEVTLANYPFPVAQVVGTMGAGRELMTRMRQIGALLLSSEMAGIAEQAMQETIHYTKQRKQFGTEIAKFQAMKHLAADMYLQVESAKAAVEYAAWAVDTDHEEGEIAVSIAKSYASDAATEVTASAIQMHGGIGFTWENNMHLYYKRARRSAAMLGSAYEHREIIAMEYIDALETRGYEGSGTCGQSEQSRMAEGNRRNFLPV